MKTHKFLIYLSLVLFLSACEDQILNLNSLDKPDDETFYVNERELEMALAGVYNSMLIIDPAGYQVPIITTFDNAASDIGVARLVGGHLNNLGAGTQSAANFGSIYANYYVGIARANALLLSMDRAIGVSQERYREIKGQALAIRAFHYLFLTELFGDVPFPDKIPQNPAEGLFPRLPKAEIADILLDDLNSAAGMLPAKWKNNDDQGRITRGFALGLRARIALYNGRYADAIASAKAIMDNEAEFGYQLHPNYKELFQLGGKNSSEIMLRYPSAQGFKTTSFPDVQGSRNLAGSSVTAPTQSLVDSYECIDGKPIDESDMYDPKRPFENRDPRLEASIVTPRSKWAGIIFESHPDSAVLVKADGTRGGVNNDSRSGIWAAAFCGYIWKKYTVEEYQAKLQKWDDIGFSLMRYAEILLIYAEAKIMSDNIDQSVPEAINRVRARAYGVSATDTDNYPAIKTLDKAELLKVIRRERKVELANEGFRLFDIRRWRIAEKVMPVKIYGRVLDYTTATGIPQIDDDCFVTYNGIESQYDYNTDARFANAFRIFNPARDYLCPIPQTEIDAYKRYGGTLSQNPGY